MKRISSFSLFLLLIIVNCQPTDDDFLTIRGQVTDESSNVGLSGSALLITSPESFSSEFVSSDSAGNYVFGSLDISDATDITIRASQTGYNSISKTITALPNQVVNLDFELTEEGTTPIDGEDEEVEGEPGLPAALILTNISETSINIRQTGGTVNSSFSFTVQDSAGRKMNAESPVTVNFRLIKGPDGGEAVVPSSVETNSDGQVVSSLFSGDSAGVVRLEAYIERNDGVRISSTPILIAINGGFPAPDRFFVAPINFNLEGYGYLDPSIEYSIAASVGDRYGNPVKTGTAVDFRSEAGRIDGSAITNARGFASVKLSPDGSTPRSGTADVGFFTITAKTVDENNDYIEKEVMLLFTTRTADINFPDPSFNVPANGSDNVSFTVTDQNGRPMAAGTTIVVTTEGSLSVSGDSNVKLGDYFAGGSGITNFLVTISDLDDENSNEVSSTLTVTVTTPSGNTTTATISGVRAKVFGN